jgi:hypothetical protein
MADHEYQRLTGWRRGRRFSLTPSGASSLWLGNDHILKIDSAYFREQYKRFYFRDIQSIIVRRTRRREIWNLALSLLTLVCIGLLAAAYTRSNMSLTLVMVFAVPLIVLFSVNNVRGATCAVSIRTAVQTEELPSLSRLERTQHVFARLRPLIAAAQADLPGGGPQFQSQELPKDSPAARADAAERRAVTGPLNLS